MCVCTHKHTHMHTHPPTYVLFVLNLILERKALRVGELCDWFSVTISKWYTSYLNLGLANFPVSVLYVWYLLMYMYSYIKLKSIRNYKFRM